MEAKLEILEDLNRKYTFAVKWEEINKEVAERLKKQQRKAKVSGFRPGKAPLKMIESMYGPAIQEEVINEKVPSLFFLKASEDKLRVAGYPSFEADSEQTDKDHLMVNALFEVFPEVTIGDLSAKEIDKISCEVTDAEVEETINILRKQRTRFDHVERAAKDQDRVIVDFKGTVDGVEFEGGSGTNFPFVLGEGRMLPEFEKGVLGLKEGEDKDVEVTFPEEYHAKDLSGKKAMFNIKVISIAEAILPEINEEFARSLGIADGDVEKMHAEVRKNVTREVKRRTTELTKENAMNALLEVSELPIPNALVQEETVRLMNEMRQNFANQGIDTKSMPDFPADMFKPQAEKRVRLGLLVSHLIEENKIEAKDDQIKTLIEEFADSYEDPKEVIDWYFSDEKNLQGPKSLVLEANVVDFILGKAKTNEKKMSFDEIMNSKPQNA